MVRVVDSAVCAAAGAVCGADGGPWNGDAAAPNPTAAATNTARAAAAAAPLYDATLMSLPCPAVSACGDDRSAAPALSTHPALWSDLDPSIGLTN
jgi:hypothetical protein